MTKRRLLPLSLLLFPLCFTVAAQDSPAPRLEIVIVQDDGAINNIKQRTARETIVEVRDENHKPVAGATVSFVLPADGPGGLFAGGGKSAALVTNNLGRAAMPAFQPNQAVGAFQVHVNASSAGRAASLTLNHSNVAAASAGGSSASSSSAHAGISGKTIGIIAGIAAAGAVGAAVGLRGGKSPSAPPVPSGTISIGTGQAIGAPF